MAWQCKHSLFMLCTRPSTRKECALDVANKLIDMVVHSYIMKSIARPLTTELAMMDFSHKDLFMSDFMKELCNFKSIEDLLVNMSMKYSSLTPIKQNVEDIKVKDSDRSDETELKLNKFLSGITESELNIPQIEGEQHVSIKEVEFKAGQIIDEPLSRIEEKNEPIIIDDSSKQNKEEAILHVSVDKLKEIKSSCIDSELNVGNLKYPSVSEKIVNQNKDANLDNYLQSLLNSEQKEDNLHDIQEDEVVQKNKTSNVTISQPDEPCVPFTFESDIYHVERTEEISKDFEEQYNSYEVNDETKLLNKNKDKTLENDLKCLLNSQRDEETFPDIHDDNQVRMSESSGCIVSESKGEHMSSSEDYMRSVCYINETNLTSDIILERDFFDNETKFKADEITNKNLERIPANEDYPLVIDNLTIKDRNLTMEEKDVISNSSAKKQSFTKESEVKYEVSETKFLALDKKDSCKSFPLDYSSNADIISEKFIDYPLVVGHQSIRDETLIREDKDLIADSSGKKESFTKESEVKYKVSEINSLALDKKESCKSFPLDYSSTVDVISEKFVDNTFGNKSKSVEIQNGMEDGEITVLNADRNPESMSDKEDYPLNIDNLPTSGENLIVEDKYKLSDSEGKKESFTKESQVKYEVSEIASLTLDKKESCKSFPVDYSSNVCIISEKVVDQTFDNKSKSVEIMERNEEALIIDSDLKFDLCQTLVTTSVEKEVSHGSMDLERYLVKDKILDEPEHLNSQQDLKPTGFDQQRDEDNRVINTEVADETKLKFEQEALKNDQISLSIIRENKDFMSSQKEIEFETCQTVDINSIQKQESYSSFKAQIQIDAENMSTQQDGQNLNHPLITDLENNENTLIQNTDASMEIYQTPEMSSGKSKESGLYFVLEDPFMHNESKEKTEDRNIPDDQLPKKTSEKSNESGLYFVLEDPFLLSKNTMKTDENILPDQVSLSIVQENKDFQNSKNEIEFEACQSTDLLSNQKQESYSSFKLDHEIREDNVPEQLDDQSSLVNPLWISNIDETEKSPIQNTDVNFEICQIPEIQVTLTEKSNLSYVVEDSVIPNQSTLKTEDDNIQNDPMSLMVVQGRQDLLTSHNEVEFEACQTNDLHLNKRNERYSSLKADNNIEEDPFTTRLEERDLETKPLVHYFEKNKDLKQMPSNIQQEICHLSDKVSIINEESFSSFNCENVQTSENLSENKEDISCNLEQKDSKALDNEIDIEAGQPAEWNDTEKESSPSLNPDLLIRDDEASIRRELYNLELNEDEISGIKLEHGSTLDSVKKNNTEKHIEISQTNPEISGSDKPGLTDKKNSANFTLDYPLVTSNHDTNAAKLDISDLQVQENEVMVNNFKYEESQTPDLMLKQRQTSCMSFSVDYLPSVEGASVKAEDKDIDVLLSQLIQNLSENFENENKIEPDISNSVDCNFCSTDDNVKDSSCVDDPCNECSDHGEGFKQSSIGDFIVLICSEDSDEIDRQKKNIHLDEPFRISITFDNREIYTNQTNLELDSLIPGHKSKDRERDEQGFSPGMAIQELITKDKDEYEINDMHNENKISEKNNITESVIEKVDNFQEVVYRKPVNYQNQPKYLDRKDSQVHAMKISNFCDISDIFDESENLNTTTGFHMPNTVSEFHHRDLNSIEHSLAEDEFKSISQLQMKDIIPKTFDDNEQTLEQIFISCSHFILEFTIEKYIFESIYSIVESAGKSEIHQKYKKEEIHKSWENLNVTHNEFSTKAWIGSLNTPEQTLETNFVQFNELSNVTLSGVNFESQLHIATLDSNTLVYAQVTSDMSENVLDETIISWILKKQALNEIVDEFLNERLSSIWSDIRIYLKLVISIDLKELQTASNDCIKFNDDSLGMIELSESRINALNFENLKKEAQEISLKLESSIRQSMHKKTELGDRNLKNQFDEACPRIKCLGTSFSTSKSVKKITDEYHDIKLLDIRIKSECEIIKTISKHISSSEVHNIDLINSSINTIVDDEINEPELFHPTKSMNRINIKPLNVTEETSIKEKVLLETPNEETSNIYRLSENTPVNNPSFSSLSTYGLADVSSTKPYTNETLINVYVENIQVFKKTILENRDQHKIESENISILTSIPKKTGIPNSEPFLEEALEKNPNSKPDYFFYSSESQINLNLSMTTIEKPENIAEREIFIYNFYENESLEIISENERINILAFIETIIIENVFEKYQMENQSVFQILVAIVNDLESELWYLDSFLVVKAKYSEKKEKEKKFKSPENESDLGNEILEIDNYRNCVTEEEEYGKDSRSIEEDKDNSSSYKTIEICSLTSSSTNNQNLFQNLSNKYNIFDIFSIDILRNSKSIILSLNSREKANSFLINRKPGNNFNGDNSFRITQNLIRHLCLELNRNLRAQYPVLTSFKFAGYENHSNGKFTLKFSNKFSPFDMKLRENSGKYLLSGENDLSIVETDSSRLQTVRRENSRNQITILCLWWLSGGICLLSFIYTILLLFDSNNLDGNWT